jgi:hypothetical protein
MSSISLKEVLAKVFGVWYTGKHLKSVLTEERHSARDPRG